MKKPRIALLRRAINDEQNELRRHDPEFHPTNHLAGWCQNNQRVATMFGGHVYDTEVPSRHGNFHTIAVVATRGSRKGHVVDITQDGGIVGEVKNIRDEGSVAQALTQLFSIGGWKRRK